MKTDTSTGFTVIELLMTMAVAAVLVTLAVPSFSALTLDNRISTQTNDFITALVLARNEALKRVSRVTVCRSSNGTACASTGDWEQGWIVFADDDNDAALDAGEEILLVRSALEASNTLRGNTNVAQYVSYVSSGATRLTNGGSQAGVLALCDHRGAGDSAREIVISATGRVRVETGPASCSP